MESSNLQAARDLASAMRLGLEARLLSQPSLPDAFTSMLETTPDEKSLAALDILPIRANLLGHPPVAKPGRLGRLVLFMRRVLKGFMQPWLEFQTLFNRSVIDSLEALRAETRGLLDKRSASLWRKMEQYYDTTVNRELGSGGKIAAAGLWFKPSVAVGIHNGRPEVLGVNERILEHFFVHTRLPQPPARVLALGCSSSTYAVEMASFGYEVTGVDRNPPSLHHPSLTMLRAGLARLPLPAESFDVVVSLSTVAAAGLDDSTNRREESADREVVAEARRMLRPGGRFVLSVPFGRPALDQGYRVYDQARLDALLGSFRRVETLFGIRQGLSWSVSAEGRLAEQTHSAEQVSAVALVVAEKPPCTC